MKRHVFVALLLLSACTERVYQVPPMVRAPNPDSLKQLANLPPYLVPPPAQATPKQVGRWTDAQTKALMEANSTAQKVKLKNVGNDQSQQGITGRQLTTSFILLGVVALLLWLGPRLLPFRGGD
ncbi:hypothetical protein [Hymenobacter pini]|uniref:hypothetical protein n=1 Tax=Hymenobacter pini TaxID=2880879 RepID=UPI001CF1A6B8|nr:hypothetical protein [Hymenobacter pini]MCA8831967.1 hypothetical protein [Hymenobacter pini]